MYLTPDGFLPAEEPYCKSQAEELGWTCPPVSSYCAQPRSCLPYMGTPSAEKHFAEKALMKCGCEVLEGVVLEGQA